MEVFRISRRVHATDLSGAGAGLYGGRWNPPGINMLYTASSISLGCIEYLAHNIHLMNNQDLVLVTLHFSEENSLKTLTTKELPEDWNEKSYLPQRTQQVGLEFIKRSEHHALQIPSSIIPQESNYLFNPLHPLHKKVRIIAQIDPFEMDERLFIPKSS